MTTRKILVIAVILCGAALPLLSSPAGTRPADETRPVVTVLFTPGDDCIGAVVKELDAARRSVYVQAYVLTSDKIGAALALSKERGLDVQVLLDAQLADCAGSEAQRLISSKVPVSVDALHEKAHNKIIVIDGSVVVTGSFDFSEQDQAANADNLLIIKGDPALASRFERNWSEHVRHSLPYVAGDKAAATHAISGTQTDKRAGAGDQDVVYVTQHGERYHRKNCQFVRDGAEAITREEATRRGKTPCKTCRPE